MSLTASRGRLAESENLILTPSKLRLHSHVFGSHVTFVWLPHAVFAGLLLLKVGHAAPLAWWVVFLPEWIAHACHLMLVVMVLLHLDKLVTQQLGPAPPARASPGMVMQYTTMFAERRSSMLVDNVCALIENAAGVLVKGMICRGLTKGILFAATFSWRLLLLPCWVAWGLTFMVSVFKPKRERTMGTMRDLVFISLLFVALKLDGIAAYTWSVVFLIPWMWFGALFLAAIVTFCVICVAYSCTDFRELALPGGFLLLLLSASAQLPCFIYLCNYLDGDKSITFEQIFIPQVASWSAMWLSGLIISCGLWKKEKLRLELASSGQVWTAHEGAARELMSLELEDIKDQVDKMTNEELAQVAMRMMAGKAQPQQLLRVGTSLYRRAMSCTATSPKGTGLTVIQRLSDRDGTAPLAELTGAIAMEEGRPWPTQQEPASTSEGGTVHVSIHLVSRPASVTAAQPGQQSYHSSGSCPEHQSSCCPQQQQQQQQGLPIVDASTEVEGNPSSTKAAQPPPTASEQSAGNSACCVATEADDGLCTICFDNEASCVFMECGHGGYCWRCAHVLFARPPSECPVCRQPIQQVVELEDKFCQVGRPAKVKQLPAVAKSGSGSGSWFGSN